ncbi:HD domain-containing protein [Aquimarina addita]|uniref:HD domain-containing protein n=1 Tax=Aquimarina addita TaxID=870485 RepID=A0ABP6UMT9_9FLAO
MTQELYQKAMKFAGEKHSDQQVPGTTANYLLHIANVSMEVLMAYNFDHSFDIDFAIQTAILHDTLEDTTANYEELKNEFGEPIAKALQALTKDENLSSKEERMTDSLHRINQLQKEVGLVKIADRITNLQTPPPHWTIEKISNYIEEAKLIAKSIKNKNEYLHTRLYQKVEAYQKNLKNQ